MDKRKVAIVGATGIAGQQAVACLQNHPWFEITCLAASERSAGKKYSDALKDEKTGARRWWCSEEPADRVLALTVENAAEMDATKVDMVVSAVESDVAKELEPKFAKTTPVISTASAFRYEPDVPILIPAVNMEHAELLNVQRKKRGWKGFVMPIPNCTTTGLAITLKPIYDKFGINNVIMTSMQAVSGAGRSPGVPDLDILDNIVPYIVKEEEKVQVETQKILGKMGGETVAPANFKVSCTCTRANVLDGHTEAVFVSTKKPCSPEEVKEAMRGFGKELAALKLPSAPKNMIIVHDDPFRPQPRLDRDAQEGMATSVGRVRKDDALENGIKYVLVSHNTKMGAAKGAVLVAEYLLQKKYF